MSPEHFKGARSEHIAAAYFLSHNINVYWPAVQQGPHDFVVSKDGTKFQTVQVKTATFNKASKHSYLQCRLRLNNKAALTSSDIVAIVHDTGLWIIPNQALDTSNLSLGSSRVPRRPTRWDRYKVL